MNRALLALSLSLVGCPAPSAMGVDAAQGDAGALVDSGGSVDAAPSPDALTLVDGGGAPLDANVMPDSGAPCAASVVELAGITDAQGLAHVGTRLFTTRGGDVVSLALDGSDPHTLAAATGGDFFGEVVALGNVVVAGTTGHGHRVARAAADGTGTATYYDLSTYTAYDTAVPNGTFAFSPRSGHVATDGTTIFVQDQNYGGLVALDATTLAPVGFLYSSTTDYLGGTSAWVLAGHHIVAMIDRAGIGITPLTAIRVFDVTTPSAMTQVGQVLRTDALVGDVAFDAANSRFVYTTQQGVYRFTLDAAGVPSAPVLMYSTGSRQARGLALVGAAFVIGAPSFSPTVDRQVQVLGEIPAGLALRTMVGVSTFGDVVVPGTGEAFAANEEPGGAISRITLTSCP
jgi:hypothetical protein